MCLKDKPKKSGKAGDFACKKCGAVASKKKKKKLCKPKKLD